ncbi:MAG: hypothetical protein ACXVZT_02580 [Terriglobales bacterium]
MRHRFFCVLAVLVLTTLTCFSQQREITQFSLIAGPSYLATPSLNLAQRGFNLDFATNYRPWVSMGFDFSAFTGGTTLMPKYLNAATQAKLGALPKPLFMSVAGGVPFTTSTYTYQMGPQLNYRHFRKVTLFVRPALGLLHAKFQTHPEKLSSPYATPVIMGLLNGKLSSADTSVFYGFGGGATWEIHPNFGLRATMDLARYNFFAQTLNGARNSVRFSVTTKFGFGRNIMSKY